MFLAWFPYLWWLWELLLPLWRSHIPHKWTYNEHIISAPWYTHDYLFHRHFLTNAPVFAFHLCELLMPCVIYSTCFLSLSSLFISVWFRHWIFWIFSDIMSLIRYLSDFSKFSSTKDQSEWFSGKPSIQKNKIQFSWFLMSIERVHSSHKSLQWQCLIGDKPPCYIEP